MILGENNEKMSKSRGNVINPDEIVDEFGADTFRTYEMFVGAFDQATPWSMNGVKGCYKFLERVWNLQDMLYGDIEFSPELEGAMHKTIKKVGDDIERMKFNTALATMMSLVNDFYRRGRVSKGEFKIFLILLNPTAPHITEELWRICGFKGSISDAAWPKYDEAKTVDDEIEIVIQINGKVRDKLIVSSGLDKEATENAVRDSTSFQRLVDGKQVVKVVVVPGKLVNVVIK
jgi:leucyl-tRNA synthetase